MLLRLYYLYEKSRKKVGELITDLKEVFELLSGGNIPVRLHGSRGIGHKRKALQRVLDRYGAYITHLTALTEDTLVKPDDKARLKGYLKKWMQYKVLFSCALYIDIIKPAYILSLPLQSQDVDIVLGIKNILKAVAALDSLSKLNCLELPTVKLFQSRIKEEGGEVTYQGAVLLNYSSDVKERCMSEALKDLNRLDGKLQERLSWSNIKLLQSLLIFLETQTWIKRSNLLLADNPLSDDIDTSIQEDKEAVEVISSHFKIPLEAKNLTTIRLQDEVEEVVEYARKYLNISEVEYRKIWYKLFCCPNSGKWPNILILCELAFSLPFSNGRVGQIFSRMKVIKSDRRTNMQASTLNDLMEIYVEGPPLSSFSPDNAIKMWWDDCSTTRRVNKFPVNNINIVLQLQIAQQRRNLLMVKKFL